MVKYVHSQRDRGIRFNSEGNLDLLTLYGASNKGDYGDSKVSAGYVVMFAGPTSRCFTYTLALHQPLQR